MDAARWERMQALFHEALEQPAAQRSTLLDEACKDDPELAADVRALLAADAECDSPLDAGVADLARDVLGVSVPMLRQVGPYRIQRVLGRGGMGVVYLAEREDLGRQAAIKVLRDASLSPARRARFAREEQTLAQLTHPSIAQLYDADTLPNGTPYFIMEYVEGAPLTDHCAAHDCTLAERLRLFRAACEAVQHAHRQAVVHRDLKPSNIFVNKDGQVKLLDFGIAEQVEALETPPDETQADLRLMTPAYAAPEQLRGAPVGVYTDVYALGVLLYELLTGQHPYDLDGKMPRQVVRTLLEQKPKKPSAAARRTSNGAPDDAPSRTLGKSAWADLDVLCLTAMHKDPQHRYPTVEALLRDLGRFQKDKPLEARPDTLGYRLGKFLRRHRQPLTAAALAAAVIIGLMAFYTVQLAKQRNRAQTETQKAEHVSEYLIGLFEASDPYAADSLDPYAADSLSVRTLLERGQERAEALSGQPAVQAQMLDVLGQVHVQLSQYDRADSLLRQALALRRRHLNDAPLDVAESLANRGVLFVYTSQYDSAEAAMREALALREKHLPPNHPDLATNLDDLGVILSRKGEYEAAETYYRLALRMRRAIYEEPHEDLGHSLNNLAVNFYRQGNYPAAAQYYRQALAVDRAVFGPGHPSVATDLANLGKLYEEQDDYAAADSLLTRALHIRRRALGEEHYETALSLSQLGGLLRRKGDYDRAETYLRDALAIRKRLLPPNHSSTAITLSHLASTLRDRGAYDQAGPLYRQAVDMYRASLGEEHWFTAVGRCNLAYLLYLKGEHAAAEPLYREGLSILEEALPSGHHTTAYNKSLFGVLLTAQARFAEAEPLLVGSYETLKEHYDPDHEHTRKAAQGLVDLYMAWEKPDKAAPFRATLAEAQ